MVLSHSKGLRWELSLKLHIPSYACYNATLAKFFHSHMKLFVCLIWFCMKLLIYWTDRQTHIKFSFSLPKYMNVVKFFTEHNKSSKGRKHYLCFKEMSSASDLREECKTGLFMSRYWVDLFSTLNISLLVKKKARYWMLVEESVVPDIVDEASRLNLSQIWYQETQHADYLTLYCNIILDISSRQDQNHFLPGMNSQHILFKA